MATRKDDSLQSISVQLDGKNYSYWGYVMKNFLRGKSMWGYVTGVRDKPTDQTNPDYAVSLDVWEADNLKIIALINNSVAHSISAQLAKYETAKEVWDHLARLYTQSNFAKQYQLETDIRALQQKDMSIQDFYSTMSSLWDQLALTESAELRAFSPYIARREEQRLVQFLMALRNDFEGLRGTILHRNPILSIDSVVSELLAEEIRLKSHVDKGTIPTIPSVFAAPQRPQANHQNRSNTKLQQQQQRPHNTQWKPQQQHQPSLNTPWKPQQQHQPSQNIPWKPGNPSNQWTYRPPQSNNAVAAPSLDPYLFEQFQQFLASQPHAMSASSHIGLSSSGTSGISSSIWVLDYGTSHHMSPDLSSFASLSHNSSIEIVTADDTPIPLVGVGSLVTCCLSLPDVYYIPTLTLNLVSVSQLYVWGPSPVPTKGGSRYYVSFIDDCTRYCWVYVMKHRSDYLAIFNDFKALVKNQHSVVIKCFRCDLEGEYTSNDFSRLLASDGTIRQTSCRETPEQNGVAEIKHRHIVETAPSFLLSSNVPSAFWGEAILIAVHVINRIPTSHNSGLSPFEKMYGHAPYYSSLRVFGCACFVLRPQIERNKFSPRSALYVFLGYGIGQKGYPCFDPISQKLYVSRHVVFLEHVPFFSIPVSFHNMTHAYLIRIDPFTSDTDKTLPTTTPETPAPPNPPTTTQSSPGIADNPPLRQSTRVRKSTRLPNFSYSCYSSSFASFVASVHRLSEPLSYSESVGNPLWQKAMAEELTALH
ncbi:uncharacterized protein LOC142528343 [Primulina tabacum]|uniref:uncharacterized protein LOC142528343 n=1 Tax=Primulina tabacum TaxID=48773 RepID=UPI003F5A6089